MCVLTRSVIVIICTVATLLCSNAEAHNYDFDHIYYPVDFVDRAFEGDCADLFWYIRFGEEEDEVLILRHSVALTISLLDHGHVAAARGMLHEISDYLED